MTFPIVYEPAQYDSGGPMPGARLLMASILQLYPGSTNLGWYHQGKRVEPGAALTAPALANTGRRGVSVTKRTCSVDGCVKPYHAKGFCGLHLYRWKKHGDPTAGRIPNGLALKTLTEIVNGEHGDECIPWPLTMNGHGYGQMRFQGKNQPAHRAALIMHSGPPPTPKHMAAHAPVVCHNPSCVNPKHLRWATWHENEADKILDGTA